MPKEDGRHRRRTLRGSRHTTGSGVRGLLDLKLMTGLSTDLWVYHQEGTQDQPQVCVRMGWVGRDFRRSTTPVGTVTGAQEQLLRSPPPRSRSTF